MTVHLKLAVNSWTSFNRVTKCHNAELSFELESFGISDLHGKVFAGYYVPS
jgi:hypothetical protein